MNSQPSSLPPRNSNGMPIAPFKGYARNFLGSGYNCPALKLFGYSSEASLNRAISKASGATMRNRFGFVVTVGARVRFHLARGGHSEGTVKAIDRVSSLAKAYGARVSFTDSGYSVSVDDCGRIDA